MTTETAIQTKIATGMPASLPAARVRISGVASVRGAKPPVWATIRPRMTLSTPRVKIIDGMRRHRDAEAVDEADRERRRRGRRGSPSGPPTVVAIIAAAVSVQGTERSMWPRRMTIIIPAATRPRKAPVWSCCSR